MNDETALSNMEEIELLRYEISSSWWAPLIGFNWGQQLAAKYFSWKTSVKYKRYILSKMKRQEMIARVNP